MEEGCRSCLYRYLLDGAFPSFAAENYVISTNILYQFRIKVQRMVQFHVILLRGFKRSVTTPTVEQIYALLATV